MAAHKTLFRGLLSAIVLIGCNSPDPYQLNPETRIPAVIVDTVAPSTPAPEVELVVIPEIPATDTAQRLPDDPPPTYKPDRPETVVPVVVTTKSKRERLQELYKSQVGIREKTGKNDGPDVERFLKAVGLGPGYSWCAAVVKYDFDQVGQKTTINGWSPTAHNPANVVYFQGQDKKPLEAGDVFTIWSASKKRIVHTGFVDRENNGFFETYEGNTNDGGSANGDGFYKRKRIKRTVYSVTRWLNP